MGSAPNHPFYLRVIQRLEQYARNWRLPYLTVMLSTGPLFLSIMWKEYIMSGPPEELQIAIMPEEWYLSNEHPFLTLPRYSSANTTIFSSFGGSSWHGADANLIFWVRPFRRAIKY
jgi:mannosyltransferase OCH1-like enzyme